jgi:hypothetical protein
MSGWREVSWQEKFPKNMSQFIPTLKNVFNTNIESGAPFLICHASCAGCAIDVMPLRTAGPPNGNQARDFRTRSWNSNHATATLQPFISMESSLTRWLIFQFELWISVDLVGRSKLLQACSCHVLRLALCKTLSNGISSADHPLANPT